MPQTRPLSPRLYSGLRRVVELGFGRDLRLLEPLLRGYAHVADLGCGSGELTPAIASGSYLGLDWDLGQLGYAADKYGTQAKRFACADLTRLPLADAALPALLFSKAAHHMDDDQVQAVLAEALRIAVVGAKLVIVDVYPAGHGLMHDLLVNRELGEHHRQPGELERLAIEVGWTAIERHELRKPTLACYVLVMRKPEEFG
ncbi:MAG: class I SAM-dependent methyltransferase [Candidatus Alcyoniella australis]|nr:class I SAM-dependent methyltransferase [Candidatus Alcyoniella australis]